MLEVLDGGPSSEIEMGMQTLLTFMKTYLILIYIFVVGYIYISVCPL